MFNFGGTEQTVALYREDAGNVFNGPGFPEGHYSEMDEENLRNLFTYLWIMVKKALRDGAEEAVIETLVADYDEVFLALVEASDEFKRAVEDGAHHTPFGYEPSAVAKYRNLAGVRPLQGLAN